MICFCETWRGSSSALLIGGANLRICPENRGVPGQGLAGNDCNCYSDEYCQPPLQMKFLFL